MTKENDDLFLEAMKGIQLPKSLSSLVTTYEASLFDEFLQSNQRSFEITAVGAVNGLRKCLLPEIKAVLGNDVDLQVQGSFKKGTFWRGSDIDALIDTGEREVTREEQKELTERLSKHQALSRVGLGCVAIHFTFLCVDIDLVFSNLVDKGKQPPVSKKEMEMMENLTIRLAALALKVAVNEGQRRRVANFLLEKMARCTYSFPRNNFKNAFELFVAVSQAIVNTNGEVLLSSPIHSNNNSAKTLSQETLIAAAKRLSQLLHVFCLSRFFLEGGPSKRGLHNQEQIEQWLRQIEGTGSLPQVPGWLFGISLPYDSPEQLSCREGQRFSQTLPPLPPAPTQKEIEEKFLNVCNSRSFEIFLDSPIGKYSLLPRRKQSKGTTPSSLTQDFESLMEQLWELSSLGSEVASRMLLTRMTWLEGEMRFIEGDVSQAIEIWAKSLLLSRADGDPFSGHISPAWGASVREVFERDRNNPNGAVVFCYWLLLPLQAWGEAELLLEPFLTSHPDHPGVLCAMLDVLGNQPNADWNYLDRLTSRLTELQPDEPIHVYWKALSKENTIKIPEAIACYEEWLSRASPEGRKVPRAYKQLSLLQFSVAGKGPGALKQFIETYEKGLEAEKKVLPFFQTNEPHPANILYMSVGEGGIQRVDERLVSDAREHGNEFFANGEYQQAIEVYSNCLILYPDDYRSLGNKSLSYLKLQLFSKATFDAENLVQRHPEWEKSHQRLAHARLQMKDPSKALSACRDGLSRFPDSSELKRIKQEATVLLKQMKRPNRQKINTEELTCFSEVKHKKNCKVVDLGGRGDFVSLVDALDVHMTSGKRNITIILLNSGPYLFLGPLHVSFVSSIQIIGGVCAPQRKANGKSASSSTPSSSSSCSVTSRKSLLKCEGVGPLFLVEGEKGVVDLQLQNLELQAISHCVSARGKVTVSAKNCFAKSQKYASFCAYNGGKLVLEQCIVPKTSHGGLVLDKGEATLEDCRFEGSMVVCLAVRNKSKCVLSRCRVARSKAQGLFVLGNSIVEMEGCEVVQCGRLPQASGILLESGMLRMKQCLVKGNNAQGIVVQGTGEGELVMRQCRVKENNSGVCIFQGSASISDSTIQDPSVGILFGNLTPRRSSICSCEVTSIVNPPKNALLKGNTIKTKLPSFDLNSLPGFSSLSTTPSQSPFRHIPREHFELRSHRNKSLVNFFRIDLDRPHQKVISKPFTTPPRSVPNHQLTHTAIKKAWKKTEERGVGRVLVGTICLPPILFSSIMTALMDDEGDAIFLALYNFPRVKRNTTSREVLQYLPVGSRVTIREPFLHTFASGEIGIRVDNPSDMEVDVSYSSKACHHCLKKEGDVKFKKCGGCRIEAFYCGRDCQKEDWKLHKLLH